MSATSAKVALVNTASALSGSCPTGGSIVDFVGYGASATCFEGAGPTSTLSNTTAAIRSAGGCAETDVNSADFTSGSPTPRNTASPFNVCPGDQAPSVSSTSPTDGATEVATSANITLAFSEAVNAVGSWFSISCVSSGAHTASVSGGPTTHILNPDTDFAAAESCTVTVTASQVTDQDADDPPDTMEANAVFTFTTVLPLTPIHDIQGVAHRSPKVGTAVKTQGIVTARASNGFYVQDSSPDGDPATSEGIFIFTSSSPTVAVGDGLQIVGNVTEFRPGGSGGLVNLTTTELTSPSISILSSGTHYRRRPSSVPGAVCRRRW